MFKLLKDKSPIHLAHFYISNTSIWHMAYWIIEWAYSTPTLYFTTEETETQERSDIFSPLSVKTTKKLLKWICTHYEHFSNIVYIRLWFISNICILAFALAILLNIDKFAHLHLRSCFYWSFSFLIESWQ